MKSSPYRMAAAALLTLLFMLSVYRAATQSLVHDEALTYHLYLAGPWSAIFRTFDANHHFLSTVLMRLSASIFGPSELALRLPTLLAGAWFFITIYRLALRTFADGFLFLLAIVLATANPLVLDFLVAARGYGLALACLTYGIYCLVEYCADGSKRRALVLRAAISLGLAVTANLTTLFPVIGIAAAFAVIERKQLPVLRAFFTPLAVIGLLFYFFTPIRHAHADQFYYGAASLLESLRVQAALSLGHNSGFFQWNRELPWKPYWRDGVTLAIAALSIAGLLIELPVLFRRRAAEPRDWLLLLASAALVASWAILIAGHLAIHLRFPLDRTGLYMLPLCGLVIAIMAARLRTTSRALGTACTILGVLIAAEYLIQLNWNYFFVWMYDTETKAIVETLSQQPHPATVRLGVSWPLAPSLNYYRVTRHLDWLQPVTRDGPDGEYDFYALVGSDQDRIATRGLHLIYRGSVSGTALAGK